MDVYKLENFPPEFYFNQPGPRMPPIVCVAAAGWFIVKEKPVSYKRKCTSTNDMK